MQNRASGGPYGSASISLLSVDRRLLPAMSKYPDRQRSSRAGSNTGGNRVDILLTYNNAVTLAMLRLF